jgi:hypothetical protein
VEGRQVIADKLAKRRKPGTYVASWKQPSPSLRESRTASQRGSPRGADSPVSKASAKNDMEAASASASRNSDSASNSADQSRKGSNDSETSTGTTSSESTSTNASDKSTRSGGSTPTSAAAAIVAAAEAAILASNAANNEDQSELSFVHSLNNQTTAAPLVLTSPKTKRLLEKYSTGVKTLTPPSLGRKGRKPGSFVGNPSTSPVRDGSKSVK